MFRCKENKMETNCPGRLPFAVRFCARAGRGRMQTARITVPAFQEEPDLMLRAGKKKQKEGLTSGSKAPIITLLKQKRPLLTCRQFQSGTVSITG